MIFLFFGERGGREKGFGEVNVNWEFEGAMGDKSGIRRFYRRIWKNIFYERGDKERKRGFLGMGGREGGERIYIFLKIFKGVGKSSKLYGRYFWDYGVEGKEKNRERIGGFLG